MTKQNHLWLNGHISWEQLHRDILVLAHLLETRGAWSGIVAVPTGGLIVSELLGRYFNLNLIDILSIERQTGVAIAPQAVLKKPIGDGENRILVDCVIDTKHVAQLFRQAQPRAHIAAVYVKSESKDFVDSYVSEFPQCTPIVLPWE